MNVNTFFNKYGPSIAFYGGLGGLIGTSILVGIRSPKYKPAVKEIDDKIVDIKENYSKDSKEYKKLITKEYSKKILKGVKVQLPGIILGSVSCGLLVWSHCKNVSTIASLSTAFASIKTVLDEYRIRVSEKIGSKEEEELFYDIKKEKIINPKTGKEEEKIVIHGDLNGYDFTRFFDPSSRKWDDDVDMRNLFLSGAEKEMTALLRDGGPGNFLCLNRVFEHLDIPKTEMGQLVGWWYFPDNPLFANKVSFGLDDLHNEKVRDFKNGYEEVVLLRFNCDGLLHKDYETAAHTILKERYPK